MCGIPLNFESVSVVDECREFGGIDGSNARVVSCGSSEDSPSSESVWKRPRCEFQKRDARIDGQVGLKGGFEDNVTSHYPRVIFHSFVTNPNNAPLKTIEQRLPRARFATFRSMKKKKNIRVSGSRVRSSTRTVKR